MPGGTIRGSSPVHFGAQVLVLAHHAGPQLMLAPSVGVGDQRGTAADVGAKCWCWRITRDRG